MSQSRRRRGPTAEQRRAQERARAERAREEREYREFVGGRDAGISEQIAFWRADLSVRGVDEDPFYINPLGQPARMTDPFSNRIHPVSGEPDFHTGSDLVPADGSGRSEVVAAYSGRVLHAGWYSPRGGNMIIIGDDAGNIEAYGHLANGSLAVRAGDRVEQGQRIGTMGNTGRVTAAHLHYVFRRQPVQENLVQQVLDVPGDAIGSLIERFTGPRDDGDGISPGPIPYLQVVAEDAQSRAGSVTRFSDYTYTDPVINGRSYTRGNIIPNTPAPVRAPRVNIAESLQGQEATLPEGPVLTSGPTAQAPAISPDLQRAREAAAGLNRR